MVQEQLFSLALGLVPPWLVDRVTFSAGEKRLDLYIDFPRGSRFPCPVCGQECPVHDTVESQWRHLDFFQHAAYLHVRVPRVKCPEHGAHQVPRTQTRTQRRHPKTVPGLIRPGLSAGSGSPCSSTPCS